jgi:hypothetical protein
MKVSCDIKSVVMKSSMFMPHGVDDAFMPPWLPMVLLMHLKMYIASNWSKLNPIHLSNRDHHVSLLIYLWVELPKFILLSKINLY